MSQNQILVMAELLRSIFPDSTWDDSAEDTARRVVEYWQSLVAHPPEFEATTFDAIAQQMIVVRDIEFSSACAHHLLPFYGVAHVAYLPHKKMIGLSKIPRIVQWMAQRPQVQERLTAQIAGWMQNELEPKGSAVIIKATHTCMSCRGVMARNASMVTSEMRGVFLTAMGPREEFLAMIGGVR